MGKAKHYTPKEDNVIKTLYLDIPNFCIGSLLKRSRRSIQTRAFALGVKKSKAYIDRLRKETYFKKGFIPFNKGLKQSTYMSNENIEKTAKGRFKKGSLPHNTQPIGHERIDKDGYTYIKIEGKKSMVLKQRHVYKQAYGKIPLSHVILFRDRNPQNFCLDNLECISRQELMERNTIQRFPKDLQVALKLTSKLNKIINDKSNSRPYQSSK